MRVRYLTDKAYETLMDNISVDKDKYLQEEVWLPHYFDGKEFYMESRIDVVPVKLHMDGDKNASDLINTKCIFDTFGEMTPQQASNPYLWTYLSMVDFWKYSKWRWGRNAEEGQVEDDILQEDKAQSTESKRAVNIKQRYLCTNSRIGLLRNSISRLWWYGYLSYNPDSQAHKYELTTLLLSQSDLCQSIVERNFSMNRNITFGILSAIQEINNDPKLDNVDRSKRTGEYEWRDLCKYINRFGAVTLLDSLSSKEVEKMSYNYILNQRE